MKNLFKIFGIILLTGMICIGCNSDVPEITEPDDANTTTSTTSTTTTSTDYQEEYGPVSTEGRLAVEAVDGGIKVTVKLLDEDINALFGRNIQSNTVHVEDLTSKIEIDFRQAFYDAFNNKTKPQLKAQREISEIFPFVEKDKKYTFALNLHIYDTASVELIEYKTEKASCSATNDGLALADYFDFNYASDKISLYADTAACLHMDKDITKFFKTNDVSDMCVMGSIIGGTVDWKNSEWMGIWNSEIKKTNGIYDIKTWGIEADYNSLISTNGANINKPLFENTYKKTFNYETYGIDGRFYFIFKNKPYSMNHFNLQNTDFDAVNWGKLLRTYTTDDSTKFTPLPASVGNYPFNAQEMILTEDDYVCKLIKNGTSGTFQLAETVDSTPYKEGIFTWNANTKKIYTRFTKISSKTYEETLTESWENNMLNYWVYSAIEIYDYSISGTTLKLTNTEVNSSNIKDILFSYYGDDFRLTATNYSIYCGNRYIEIDAGESDNYFIILDFGNNTMTVCEYNYSDHYLGPKFEIPYTFNNTTKELTLELEEQDYVLGYKANTGNTMTFTINN